MEQAEYSKNSGVGAFLFEKAIPSTGMRKTAFAKNLGISRAHLYDIAQGNTRLTPRIASRLDELTKVPAETWLRMQLDHDVAQLNAEKRGMESRV